MIYNHSYCHSIFEDLKDKVNAELANANCSVLSVMPKGKVDYCDLSKTVAVRLTKPDDFADNNSDPYGILVQCDNVPCIYEFRLFKYIGRHGK